MGTDIHIIVQRKSADKWENVEVELPNLDNRNYGMFGFLGLECRNYSQVPSIHKLQHCWPADIEKQDRKDYVDNTNYHSFGYISLKVLLDFDYTQKFEDKRITRSIYNQDGSFKYYDGGATADSSHGESGKVTTFKGFLGVWFFSDLETLKKLGNPEDIRLLYCFDS